MSFVDSQLLFLPIINGLNVAKTFLSIRTLNFYPSYSRCSALLKRLKRCMWYQVLNIYMHFRCKKESQRIFTLMICSVVLMCDHTEAEDIEKKWGADFNSFLGCRLWEWIRHQPVQISPLQFVCAVIILYKRQHFLERLWHSCSIEPASRKNWVQDERYRIHTLCPWYLLHLGRPLQQRTDVEHNERENEHFPKWWSGRWMGIWVTAITVDSGLSTSEWHSRKYQSAKKLGSTFYCSIKTFAI